MENWTRTKIGDLCQTFSGGTPSRTVSQYFGGNIPWIKSGELNSRFVVETEEHITEEGVKNSSAKFVNPNTILIAMYGATAGVIAISKIRATINQAILAVIPNNGSFENLYLFYQLEHSMSEVLKNLQGAQPNLNAEIIKNTIVPCPPLEEQKKIAAILSTWDSAIETCEKLIAAKLSRKRALMQQLLTGKKRFPEFQGQQLKHAFLGDVASESTERNKGAMTSEKLMAVMKTAGMIPMREHVQGESAERCKIVAPNWFAYNPMRLNIGSIAQWKGAEKVMVSGDYVVFKCDESKLDPDYLNHFRRSETWTNFVKTSGDGSVRVRIYFSHLAEMKMLLPSLEEQKRIAAVLNACNAEINLLTEKLEALKNQKRGLMQQLLTGKVRVRVEEESNSEAIAV